MTIDYVWRKAFAEFSTTPREVQLAVARTWDARSEHDRLWAVRMWWWLNAGLKIV